mmetsp:Transcript_169795/g.544934  ORF Transcript_169795/g.544934 Transcript_169795/m.544934 type:complete len:209 (-) Transcript_169795:1433-2059(-)
MIGRTGARASLGNPSSSGCGSSLRPASWGASPATRPLRRPSIAASRGSIASCLIGQRLTIATGSAEEGSISAIARWRSTHLAAAKIVLQTYASCRGAIRSRATLWIASSATGTHGAHALRLADQASRSGIGRCSRRPLARAGLAWASCRRSAPAGRATAARCHAAPVLIACGKIGALGRAALAVAAAVRRGAAATCSAGPSPGARCAN